MQNRINDTGANMVGDLESIQADLQRAPIGTRSGVDLPQIHRMLGNVTHAGWRDCLEEVAELARNQGHVDRTSQDDRMVLAYLEAGSVTGREFWNALPLIIRGVHY